MKGHVPQASHSILLPFSRLSQPCHLADFRLPSSKRWHAAHSEFSTKTGATLCAELHLLTQNAVNFVLLDRAPLSSGRVPYLSHALCRSGFIDLAEFVELLTYLKVQMSRDDATAVFMVLDSNGDGEMSQQEFEDYWIANMQNTRL